MYQQHFSLGLAALRSCSMSFGGFTIFCHYVMALSACSSGSYSCGTPGQFACSCDSSTLVSTLQLWPVRC